MTLIEYALVHIDELVRAAIVAGDDARAVELLLERSQIVEKYLDDCHRRAVARWRRAGITVH
jgi:hypothetical protein